MKTPSDTSASVPPEIPETLSDKSPLRTESSFKARIAEIFTRIKEILDELSITENTLVGEVRGSEIKPPHTFTFGACLDYVEEALNFVRSRLQSINRNLGK